MEGKFLNFLTVGGKHVHKQHPVRVRVCTLQPCMTNTFCDMMLYARKRYNCKSMHREGGESMWDDFGIMICIIMALIAHTLHVCIATFGKKYQLKIGNITVALDKIRQLFTYVKTPSLQI